MPARCRARARDASAPLILAPTPGGARLVAAVEAATARARTGFPKRTPTTIYLTAADAGEAGYRWQHFAKSDPPRCLGLPIRIILGRGRSRLYCKGGSAIQLTRDLKSKGAIDAAR